MCRRLLDLESAKLVIMTIMYQPDRAEVTPAQFQQHHIPIIFEGISD
jgi:hypothetical protein